MGKTKKVNGVVTHRIKGGDSPKVAALTAKRFSRTSLDAFAEDFSTVAEVGADDVVNGRLTPAVWNSATRGYSNMLHMIDIQMRARTMGMVSAKLKLLR